MTTIDKTAAAPSTGLESNNGNTLAVIGRIVAASASIASATVIFTYPQVVQLSNGALAPVTLSSTARQFRVSMPFQFSAKFIQLGLMRQTKKQLDAFLPEQLSVMMAYGLTGVPMQSIIYNAFIADVYRVQNTTGAAAAVKSTSATSGSMGSYRAAAADFVSKKLYPGLAWCFIRESCATGGGLALGPYASLMLQDVVGDQYPKLTNFAAGLGCGAFTALCTQWLHNTCITAGTMAEVGPHYPTTMSSLRQVYQDQGVAMMYRNYGRRMFVIATATAALNTCEIFKD